MKGDDEYEYVENTDKPWRSSYSHQRRPDVMARTKNAIPRDRLVTKKGRYFTTDTRQQQLVDEIDKQDERKGIRATLDPYFDEGSHQPVEASKPKKTFTAKNSSSM